MKLNIDVLIPCAGNAFYFEESLDSILSQSVLPSKIYILDNACKHNLYYDISKSKKNSIIEYIRFENRLSMAENWQRCLRIGNSPYLTFMHDDDLWLPNYLDTIRKCISNNPDVSVILSGQQHFRSQINYRDVNVKDIRLVEICKSNKVARNFLLPLENCCHMSALVFKRSFSFSFNINYRWLIDQNFFNSIIFFDELHVLEHTNVLIRLSDSNGTFFVMEKSYALTERIEHFRNIILMYSRIKGFNASQLFENDYKPTDGLLKRIKHACFSWPLNFHLLSFGLNLAKLEANSSFWVFMKPFTIIYWISFSLLADIKYFLKSLKE